MKPAIILCPFCGCDQGNSVVKDESEFFVLCGNSECLSSGPLRDKAVTAIKDWNRRTQ